MSNKLQIQRLTIKNFLGIKFLEITPDGAVNVLKGANGSGKTSVIKALESAFGGMKSGKQYLHKGETEGEIIIDLNQFNIHRKITEKGNYLKVEKDGMEYKAPQTILDSFVGEFAFNPIEFAFADGKKRNQIILGTIKAELDQEEMEQCFLDAGQVFPDELAGVQLLDAAEKAMFGRRQEVNRGIGEAEKSLKTLNESLPADAPAYNEEEHKALKEKLHKAEVEEDMNNGAIRDMDESREQEAEMVQEIEKMASNAQTFTVAIKVDKTRFESVYENYKKNRGIAQKEIDETRAKLEAMEAGIRFIEIRGKIKDLEERLKKGRAISEDLTAKIEKIRTETRPGIIEKADLGIEGLEFASGQFLVGGVELDNLADSEKLRIGVKIAQKLNQKFGILCVDGLERLDRATLKEFLTEVAKTDFQMFATTCWDSDGNATEFDISQLNQPKNEDI